MLERVRVWYLSVICDLARHGDGDCGVSAIAVAPASRRVSLAECVSIWIVGLREMRGEDARRGNLSCRFGDRWTADTSAIALGTRDFPLQGARCASHANHPEILRNGVVLLVDALEKKT